MDPREFVEWYHNKFKISYTYTYFPTIKRDHEVIISCIEKYNCYTALEIGTWKGDTAMLMWLHPQIRRVRTIDIHKDMNVEYFHHSHQLMSKEMYGEVFKNTFIDLIFYDTMTYPKGIEQFDLVFIDGNHDYGHVKNDTALAMSVFPKIIVWHDYGGGNDDVVKYINELVINGSEIMTTPGSLCVAAEPSKIILSKSILENVNV